jgi:hypothetical protein
MGAAAAVILLRERQLVEAFERAGATSPDRARTPEEVGADPQARDWQRLRERAIVREASAGDGRYYVDVEVWQALRRMRRRLIFVLLVVIAVAFVMFGVVAPWSR